MEWFPHKVRVEEYADNLIPSEIGFYFVEILIFLWVSFKSEHDLLMSRDCRVIRLPVIIYGAKTKYLSIRDDVVKLLL